MTALVAKLNQPPEAVHGRMRGNQEGDPPEGAPSPEPAPEPGRITPERLTRSDPVEKAEDELLRLKVLIEKEEQKRANLAGEEPRVLFVEDVEGGGGVGRGVFYTGLSRESVDIPYLRRGNTRARPESRKHLQCVLRGSETGVVSISGARAPSTRSSTCSLYLGSSRAHFLILALYGEMYGKSLRNSA